ncbi:ATP-dependent helicase [Pseudomonas sp. WS 5532]|nr:ATP-dependent helicase [Pseudomonas sp. WS 5532]
MDGLRLTEEQAAPCASNADVIKVEAGAGTGKTTMLRGIAQSKSSLRHLYVAFNKSIQLEAASKFPGNVTCKTAHSLAYGAVGRDYGNVPNKLQGDIKPFHVTRQLQRSLQPLPQSAHNLYGGRVIETLKNYLVSGDGQMVPKHISIGDAPVERSHFEPRQILHDAMQIWTEMQDLRSEVPMLHDGYLKLYQVANRRLPYDSILFDEAQDTNPVTQAIVDQQQAKKTYVGDRNQAIYGFRGASNAMEQIPADETFYLTGSFRFGEEVADVANKILDLKGDVVHLRGLGAPSKIRALGAGEGHAFLSRGNSALFDRAVNALLKNEPFSFVGDIKGYRFDQILDVYNLSIKGQVKDPFIRSFSSFDELLEYAEMINDREVKSRCKVVTAYGRDIPSLIERIERAALSPIVSGSGLVVPDNRIVLTTVHKSKGLEFPNVRLAGDFMEFIDSDTNQLLDMAKADNSIIEEINLAYVAVTRVQQSLHLNDQLEAYLEYIAELAANRSSRPSMA